MGQICAILISLTFLAAVSSIECKPQMQNCPGTSPATNIKPTKDMTEINCSSTSNPILEPLASGLNLTLFSPNSIFFPRLFFGSQTDQTLPSLLDTFLDIFRNPTSDEHSAMALNCPKLMLTVNCTVSLPRHINLSISTLNTYQNRYLALARSTNAQANSIQFNRFLPLPIKMYQMEQLKETRCDIAKWIEMLGYAINWKEACEKK